MRPYRACRIDVVYNRYDSILTLNFCTAPGSTIQIHNNCLDNIFKTWLDKKFRFLFKDLFSRVQRDKATYHTLDCRGVLTRTNNSG